jgi:hypothetical protein
MSEPQDLQKIDQIFKNAFDSLPDAPAASGWDTPSPRVWSNVQQQVSGQRTGWALSSKLIVTGMVMLMIGLGAWYYQDISTSKNNTTPAPVSAPAPIVAPAPADAPTVTPSSKPEQPKPAEPAATQKKKPTVTQQPDAVEPVNSTERKPKTAPNSTIREQNKQLNENR